VYIQQQRWCQKADNDNDEATRPPGSNVRTQERLKLVRCSLAHTIAYDAVEATTDWTPESPQVEFYRREGRERAPIVAHWCSGYYGLAENDARAPWDG